MILGVEGRCVKAQVIVTCYMCTEYKLLWGSVPSPLSTPGSMRRGDIDYQPGPAGPCCCVGGCQCITWYPLSHCRLCVNKKNWLYCSNNKKFVFLPLIFGYPFVMSKLNLGKMGIFAVKCQMNTILRNHHFHNFCREKPVFNNTKNVFRHSLPVPHVTCSGHQQNIFTLGPLEFVNIMAAAKYRRHHSHNIWQARH